MPRDWICPACGTRDPYTYPHHIVCRLCAHVTPRGEEPEHPAGLVPALFRRWGDPRVLEGYRDDSGAVFLEVSALESVGFVHDAVLELVFHAEGYVAAKPEPDLPDLFRLSEGSGIVPHDDSRAGDQAVHALAGLERALELLEGALGNRGAPARATEIERLRGIVEEAHRPP